MRVHLHPLHHLMLNGDVHSHPGTMRVLPTSRPYTSMPTRLRCETLAWGCCKRPNFLRRQRVLCGTLCQHGWEVLWENPLQSRGEGSGMLPGGGGALYSCTPGTEHKWLGCQKSGNSTRLPGIYEPRLGCYMCMSRRKIGQRSCECCVCKECTETWSSTPSYGTQSIGMPRSWGTCRSSSAVTSHFRWRICAGPHQCC